MGLIDGGFDSIWQSIVKRSFSMTSKLRLEIIVWSERKLTSGLSILNKLKIHEKKTDFPLHWIFNVYEAINGLSKAWFCTWQVNKPLWKRFSNGKYNSLYDWRAFGYVLYNVLIQINIKEFFLKKK